MRFALVLSLLLGIPAFCDVVYECSATAKDAQGQESAAQCEQFPSGRLEAAITGSGRDLSVHMVNYLYGAASADVGSTIDFVVRSSVSASQDLIVTGGFGSGTLLFRNAFSDAGEFFVRRATRTAYEFSSNFLPFPTHFGFHDILVPFTFDSPFSLSLSSAIEYRASDPFVFSNASWESIHQWDLSLTDILDENGNSLSSATVAAVPEPWSAVLLLTVLVLLGGSLRRKCA